MVKSQLAVYFHNITMVNCYTVIVDTKSSTHVVHDCLSYSNNCGNNT